jgi:hypothetical protein
MRKKGREMAGANQPRYEIMEKDDSDEDESPLHDSRGAIDG